MLELYCLTKIPTFLHDTEFHFALPKVYNEKGVYEPMRRGGKQQAEQGLQLIRRPGHKAQLLFRFTDVKQPLSTPLQGET